jgi:spermidine synthase
MRAREVIDRTTTPDQQTLELAREAGQYVIRVAGVPLMSSATFGSEQAMAQVAVEALGRRAGTRVLVGGLGMGFTLRAVLDVFDARSSVTVAELLPAIVGYARGPLAHLANRPLDDPRVRLYEGDVRVPMSDGGWDAILLDVDNGPSAFTTASNASLYDSAGVRRMRAALTAGGVLVVWSVATNPAFEKRLRRAGLTCETRRVRARGDIRKGSTHRLFVARAPV